MKNQQKHIIIGDVHGDYLALEKMLGKVDVIRLREGTWVSKKGYKVVLLGDLNDSKLSTSYSSSWRTLCIGRELSLSGIGILLHSNHQERLISYLDNPTSVSLKNGLDKTINELRAISKRDIDIMKQWLITRPLTYTFNVGEKLFSCAHAYYPKDNLSYINPCLYKDLCINGIRDDEGKRVPWWNYSDLIHEDRTIICGHYHFFRNTPHVIILDGKCGTNKGVLRAYIPEMDMHLRVLGSGWNNTTKIR